MEHWREMGYKLLFQTSPQVLYKTGGPILSKNKTDVMVAKCDVVFNFSILMHLKLPEALIPVLHSTKPLALVLVFSKTMCVSKRNLRFWSFNRRFFLWWSKMTDKKFLSRTNP